jgi:UPF0755 protein
MKTAAKILVVLILLAAGTAWYGWSWLKRETAPMPTAANFYIRFEPGTSVQAALTELQERKVVRNPEAAKYWIKYKELPSTIQSGSYELHAGMSLGAIMRALQDPITQMVRVPEGWWIARVAKRLEEHDVCSAAEYVRLSKRPDLFIDAVEFSLPEGSLEGYLYPDTYDLPPLIGAEETIRRQLRAFSDKVEVPEDADLHRAVTSASIIELEAALDEERAVIAGVIENRIKDRMTLDMDASVLYALQEWKVLGPGVVKTIKSPYNTYLHPGLPPGPIGSPSAKSIAAALAPAEHRLYYYVARPNRSHLFATTYAAHRGNIRKARKEWREQEDDA